MKCLININMVTYLQMECSHYKCVGYRCQMSGLDSHHEFLQKVTLCHRCTLTELLTWMWILNLSHFVIFTQCNIFFSLWFRLLILYAVTTETFPILTSKLCTLKCVLQFTLFFLADIVLWSRPVKSCRGASFCWVLLLGWMLQSCLWGRSCQWGRKRGRRRRRLLSHFPCSRAAVSGHPLTGCGKACSRYRWYAMTSCHHMKQTEIFKYLMGVLDFR